MTTEYYSRAVISERNPNCQQATSGQTIIEHNDDTTEQYLKRDALTTIVQLLRTIEIYDTLFCAAFTNLLMIW